MISFRDRPASDRLLLRLNQALSILEKRRIRRFDSPRYPVIFLTAPPRSGTALLQQCLAQRFEIGYVFNLLARFWLCPSLAAAAFRPFFQRRVVGSDFLSEYGNTKGPWGPHEWGFFWHHWLKTQDGVPCPESPAFAASLPELVKQLAALEHSLDLPLVFRSVPGALYNAALAQALPTSLFIQVKRPSLYVANSILNARIRRHGNVHAWYGTKPIDYARVVALDPVEQCVAQVRSIETQIAQDLDSIPADRVLRINYDELCGDPERTMRAIRTFVAARNYLLHDRIVLPDKFMDRNRASYLAPEYRKSLVAAFLRYYPGSALPMELHSSVHGQEGSPLAS